MRLAVTTLSPVLFVVLFAFAGAAPAAEPVTIATVDMVKLLKDHPRQKEIEKKLEQAQKSAEEWMKTEQTGLRTLEGEIELMSPVEPSRRAKEKEFAARGAAVKFELEWRQREATREYLRNMEALYTDVQAAVSRYAREQRLSVVLNSSAEDLKSGNPDDFGLKVRLRTVVFADGALDITEAVKRQYGPK